MVEGGRNRKGREEAISGTEGEGEGGGGEEDPGADAAFL